MKALLMMLVVSMGLFGSLAHAEEAEVSSGATKIYYCEQPAENTAKLRLQIIRVVDGVTLADKEIFSYKAGLLDAAGDILRMCQSAAYKMNANLH